MDLSQALDIVYNGNTVSAVYLGQTKIWPSTPPVHDYSQDYLTFDNISASCNFSFVGNDIQYSLNNGTTWSTLYDGTTLSVTSGQKIIWKASGLSTTELRLDGGGVIFTGIGGFRCSSNSNDIYFDVYGNVMSLIYGDNYIGQTALTQTEELKYLFCALTQSSYPNGYPCPIRYANNLILPATTLKWNCYGNMFANCNKLISAPALPATTLIPFCYMAMFSGCTSLVDAPQLLATTLVDNCYEGMFSGCTSLVNAPALPATTLVADCYNHMFMDCTSLTVAPELPATTLVGSCYYKMFQNCTNLNSVTCLATNISAAYCTTDWLDGVAATGTFTKAASMNDWPTGSGGIPSGWTCLNY